MKSFWFSWPRVNFVRFRPVVKIQDVDDFKPVIPLGESQDAARRTAEPPRLVAIDLDGTLFDDSKQVSARTVAAISCLPARGVKVVIATARPPRSVRQVYQQLRLDSFQINYNGALIW